MEKETTPVESLPTDEDLERAADMQQCTNRSAPSKSDTDSGTC